MSISITRLFLSGFKSIRDKVDVRVAPLTLLAGANSSGKSSLLQGLLLVKQTLEAPGDPGPLKLNGDNVKFTSFDQLAWSAHGSTKKKATEVGIGFTLDEQPTRLFFRKNSKGEAAGVQLDRIERDDLADALKENGTPPLELDLPVGIEVRRDRCNLAGFLPTARFATFFLGFDPRPVLDVIHLPGLRGNPERAYSSMGASGRFPGTFPQYTATIVASWNAEKKRALGRWMSDLGLTWKVEAKRIDDAQVEVRVGRTSSARVGGGMDLVNIADVGFGVSQALPVVVALLVAKSGQTVIIEQPELHLHPRAQVALADLLLFASRRGVNVIAETHSTLLLKAIQRAAAADPKNAELVALHWFSRDDDGATQIHSAELDKTGAYGDWPEDFADTELELEQSYLDLAFESSQT